MINNIYICHTNYHLLITLIKPDFNFNTSVLHLFNKISSKLVKKLTKLGANIIEEHEHENEYNINSNNYIFIYNDWTNIGEFLRLNRINYNLIEDGYNYYSYDLYRLRFSLKRRIFNYLFSYNIPLGYSKYAVKIEVNDKDKVIKDSRYKKMIEIPRRDLFNSLSEERKKLILDIFDVKPMNYIKIGKSILILTQPLYQDNCDREIINSEEDQINYYKAIIDKYKNEYAIYFKVHPRDSTNYITLDYNNVIFLDKDVPMELYEFVGDYKFDIGITHSSTALDYLSCVKEKIFLKDLRK